MDLVIPVLSVVISVISLSISVYIFKRSSEGASYLDIDKQYSELLKLGMQYTDLRNHEKTLIFYKFSSDNEFRQQYDIYAYMCWNLIETIYDKQRDKKGRFQLSETWLPVMFEENRLHYSWFKHNIRLFKDEFQLFVTRELNDIEIIDGTVEDLKKIYSRFISFFADSETKSLDHLEILMLKKKYKLVLAKHKVFNEIIGFALTYIMDDEHYIWLDYMAIDSIYQNSGYGTLLLNKIMDLYKENYIGLFAEIEIPDESNDQYENQIKRIRFYERLGAKKLDFKYIFPNQEGGQEMHLFFKPISNIQKLPDQEIKNVISSVFNYIHTDIKDKDQIFKSFINDIKDQFFMK